MPLAACAELDQPLRVEIRERHRLGLALDGDVVDAGAAALDQASRLALRGREPGAHEQFEGRTPPLQRIAGTRALWQLAAGPTSLEHLSGRLRRCLGRLAA